jgi:O-antigen/teichoic acid export membrane protein
MIAGALTGRLRELVQRGQDLLAGGSLKGKILRNVGWMAIGFGSDLVVRLISSAILTRLLDPSAYGLISTVMVFMVFVTLLSDLGIKPIVTADERGDDPGFLSLLWTMQVMRGFVSAGAVCAIAMGWQYALAVHWIAPTSNYANPLLPQLMYLISLALVLMGFSSLNEYRLLRHLEGGPTTRLDIISRLLTSVVTVVLALLFRSVWAIALGLVLSYGMRALFSHFMLAGPRMKLRFDWAEIKKVLTLSRWVALNSFMTVLTTQADKVLIGWGFGLATLGIYSIALTLFTSGASVVDRLNGSLGIPVIRALVDKSEADRTRDYYKFRLPIDCYCIAGGTAMVLLGPLFFKLVYDARYAAGGLYFALFGIKLILMPMHLSGNFLFAQLRYRLMSMIGLLRSIIFLSGMALAVWLQSIHVMMIFIALENLPEILTYYVLRRTGIPFKATRDGLLLGVASLLGIYLLIISRL